MSQATARVQKSLAKNLSRRGKLPAFVTSLGFLAFTALQVTLTSLAGLIGFSQQDVVPTFFPVSASPSSRRPCRSPSGSS